MFERAHANGHIGWRPQRSSLTLLRVGVLALAGAVLVLALLDPGALRVLPALALPAVLALRRYPGERMLVVLCEPRRSPRRRPDPAATPARAPIAMPRGGLLLARSLAVRPPPVAPLAAA